jgi:hypothetical protein
MNKGCAIAIGLLLSVPSRADIKDLQRIDAKIEKQKYGAAIRLANKELEEEQLTRQYSRMLNQRLGEATYLQLAIDPNSVQLEMFIKKFPKHQRMVDARKLIAGLAFEDAQKIGTEDAYLGVASTYTATPGGVAARTEAAKIARKKLPDDATPDELRAFRLRYEGEQVTIGARKLEEEAAISDARERANAGTWQALIDRYPEHPEINEALRQLHQLSWENVDSASSSATELWAYASQFPDTYQGWMAGEKALGKSLTYTHTQRQPIGKIDISLGGVPPPGWAVDLVVEVQEGEAWIPWSEAITTWTKKVGGITPPTNKGRTEVQRTAAQLSWTTPYALCTTTSKPVQARIRTTMKYGEQHQTWSHPLEVPARCPGAKRLVFTAHPDDIIGPFGSTQYNVIKQRYTFVKFPVKAPDSWNCSHVSTIDRMGATLVCGLSTVRFGWNPNEVWFRPTDVDKATTTRIVMATPKADKRLGLHATSSRLTDRSGNTIAQLAGRTAALTPLLLEEAFGTATGGNNNTPPIATNMEEIRGTTIIPVPKESKVQTVRFDPVDSPRKYKLLGAMRALYGEQIRLSHQVKIGEKRYIFVQGPVDGSPMATIGIAIDDPDSKDGWIQFIPLPNAVGARATQWLSFEHSGHQYLRTVGTSPVRGRKLRVYTFRSSDNRTVVDLADRR